MNQIELAKALNGTTSNAAEFAVKIFMPGLYGDKIELIILSILGIGIVSWYFTNEFLSKAKSK